jgi:hypothetical protein
MDGWMDGWSVVSYRNDEHSGTTVVAAAAAFDLGGQECARIMLPTIPIEYLKN